MKKTLLLLTLQLFLGSFLFTPSKAFALEEGAKPAKKPPGAKSDSVKGDSKKAYSGDPAAKRGFELGYDYGVKAGKEDKKNGKKETPTSRDDYKMADKKFRSEYGNRAKFVAGYQGGFMKGYKSGFNREKIDPEAAKQSKEKSKDSETGVKTKKESSKEATPDLSKKTSNKTPEITKPKPKAINPSDDAL